MDSKELATELSKLPPEQIEAMFEAIMGGSKGQTPQNRPIPSAKKRKQIRRSQRLAEEKGQLKTAKNKGRNTKSGRAPQDRGRSKGKAMRVESIATGPRPNEFEKFIYNTDKQVLTRDAEIDRKLSAGRKPVPRGRKRTVSVECDRCGREYDVSPILVFTDEEGHHFTCDRCQRR